MGRWLHMGHSLGLGGCWAAQGGGGSRWARREKENELGCSEWGDTSGPRQEKEKEKELEPKRRRKVFPFLD